MTPAMIASAGGWSIIAGAVTILVAAAVRGALRGTAQIVTGRRRPRPAPERAPRPVALPMSLGSTRPVFIDPHIVRPISEGTPPITLSAEIAYREHLRRAAAGAHVFDGRNAA